VRVRGYLDDQATSLQDDTIRRTMIDSVDASGAGRDVHRVLVGSRRDATAVGFVDRPQCLSVVIVDSSDPEASVVAGRVSDPVSGSGEDHAVDVHQR